MPEPVSIPIQFEESAEQVRNRYLEHEMSLRSLSVLYRIGAVIYVMAGVLTLVGYTGPVHQMTALRFAVPVFIFFVAGFLFRLGVEFRHLRRRALIPATILSCLGLLAFPVGTLVNGYVLYLIYSEKGKVVYSDAYRRVIAATPGVSFKLSLMVKIFVGLLLLALFVGVILAFMQAAAGTRN